MRQTDYDSYGPYAIGLSKKWSSTKPTIELFCKYVLVPGYQKGTLVVGK